MPNTFRRSLSLSGDDSGGKFYVLRSALPVQMREKYVPNPMGEKGPDQGLTMVVLSLIHMEGGKLKEGVFCVCVCLLCVFVVCVCWVGVTDPYGGREGQGRCVRCVCLFVVCGCARC
jgi:hypothetical protein